MRAIRGRPASSRTKSWTAKNCRVTASAGAATSARATSAACSLRLLSGAWLDGTAPGLRVANEALHRQLEPRHHGQHAIDLEPPAALGAAERRNAHAGLGGDLRPAKPARGSLRIQRGVESPRVETLHVH